MQFGNRQFSEQSPDTRRNLDPGFLRIKHLGEIESIKQEMQQLAEQLKSASKWQPAVRLQQECREALVLMDNIKVRLEHKLVVTIVGPGGAGKSSLFNALVGEDDLSPVGIQRPTTRSLVMFCDRKHDAAHFQRRMPDGRLQMIVSQGRFDLKNLILIDTPDTDSTENESHFDLVQAAVEQADVLLCVFNAENPKARDHADFMAPLVDRFHGGSLIGVLNKCDRLSADELNAVIVPQFKRYIGRAWKRTPSTVLCTSARRHWVRPAWDEKAPPKHDFDEFAALKQQVLATAAHPKAVMRRRVDNALNLRDFIYDDVRERLAACMPHLKRVRERIQQMEKAAFNAAVAAVMKAGDHQMPGINVLLYQRLAQRWVGPLGWMIALWARILIFGSGMAAIFRFGNPLRQLLGIIRSLRHFKQMSASVAAVESEQPLGAAFRHYRLAVLKQWPEVATLLSRARFEVDACHHRHALPDERELNHTLSALWREAVDRIIEQTSRRFSGIGWQLLLNAPCIGILGHVAWVTSTHYLKADYLSSDFFVHAVMTIVIVLLLSFFVFQGTLRLFAASDKLLAKTFKSVLDDVSSPRDPLNPMFQEIEAVYKLEALVKKELHQN